MFTLALWRNERIERKITIFSTRQIPNKECPINLFAATHIFRSGFARSEDVTSARAKHLDECRSRSHCQGLSLSLSSFFLHLSLWLLRARAESHLGPTFEPSRAEKVRGERRRRRREETLVAARRALEKVKSRSHVWQYYIGRRSSARSDRDEEKQACAARYCARIYNYMYVISNAKCRAYLYTCERGECVIFCRNTLLCVCGVYRRARFVAFLRCNEELVRLIIHTLCITRERARAYG